jgi:hypothetical protein
MSYIIAPNQPIPLFTESELNSQGCGCGDQGYSMPVDVNDQLFIQLISEPCDPAYTNNEAAIQAWTESYGSVCADEADPTGFYSFTFNADYPYSVFAVTITVESITQGTLSVLLQGSDAQFISSAGTVTLYFSTDIVTGGDFTPNITITGSQFIGCFGADVQVQGIPTETRIAFVDPETLLPIDGLAVRNIEVTENVLTIRLDVNAQDLTNGCYRIAVADFCTNTCSQFRLENGFFINGSEGWIITEENITWDITTQYASCTIDEDDENTYTLTSESVLCQDVEYNIQLTDVDVQTVQYRIVAGDTVTVWFNTEGVFSTSIIATGAAPINLEIQCRALTSGGVGVGGFLAFTSVQISPVDSDVSFDLFSETITIGEFEGCINGVTYFKIEGCNGQDQFGMTFTNTDFLPGVRVAGRLFRAQYDADVDLFRYSDGTRKTAYADVSKRKTLSISQQPEYVFDFLSKALFFDALFINGQSYAPVEDSFPEITWNDANDLGDLELELYMRTGKLVKVDCSGVEAGCTPSVPNDVVNGLLTQNGDQILLQNNDVLLDQNG